MLELCENCYYRYMIIQYEGEAHAFFRCPSCYKMISKRKQKEIRGKIWSKKLDKGYIEVNVYSGEIDKE